MDEISTFCKKIKDIIGDKSLVDINNARVLINEINDFLYTNYPNIGYTTTLGNTFEYLSDFHKYWENHHAEILDCKIIDEKCEQVANRLHEVFVLTNGSAFSFVYDTCGLSPQEVCRIRFMTANQDFGTSLKFDEIAEVYNSDNSIFDEQVVYNNPSEFLSKLGINDLSQNDKRILYAQNIAKFLIDLNCSPFDLMSKYNNDINALRNAILSYNGSGYGNKKTDMFLRDMFVLGVWCNVRGFENIDVASDVNTIKVALRTGIVSTEIPLVSSFLDIFCHQYEYIDKMNANAWRRVWEIWKYKYPSESIPSPCLMDYFIYNVVGKQFCLENLYIFRCETGKHTFKWHSPRNKTCQCCYRNGVTGIKAELVDKVMPCSDKEGNIAIRNTKYVKSLPDSMKFPSCPFVDICGENRTLMPPKSISILGRTGWTTAYTKKGNGGGGLMS